MLGTRWPGDCPRPSPGWQLAGHPGSHLGLPFCVRLTLIPVWQGVPQAFAETFASPNVFIMESTLPTAPPAAAFPGPPPGAHGCPRCLPHSCGSGPPARSLGPAPRWGPCPLWAFCLGTVDCCASGERVCVRHVHVSPVGAPVEHKHGRVAAPRLSRGAAHGHRLCGDPASPTGCRCPRPMAPG